MSHGTCRPTSCGTEADEGPPFRTWRPEARLPARDPGNPTARPVPQGEQCVCVCVCRNSHTKLMFSEEMIQNDNEMFPFRVGSRARRVAFITRRGVLSTWPCRPLWAALGRPWSLSRTLSAQENTRSEFTSRPRGLSAVRGWNLRLPRGPCFSGWGAPPAAHHSSKWGVKPDRPREREGVTFGVWGGFASLYPDSAQAVPFLL